MLRRLHHRPSLVLVAASLFLGTTACSGGSDGDPAADAPATIAAAAAEPNATPTVDPVVASVPRGRWQLASRIIDPGGNVSDAVERSTNVWTLRPDCEEAASCGGRIGSDSGKEFRYEWDGSAVTVVRSAEQAKVTFETDCSDAEGNVVPGTYVRATESSSRRVVLAPAGPREDTFRGRFDTVTVVHENRGCGVADHWGLTIVWTLTRR